MKTPLLHFPFGVGEKYHDFVVKKLMSIIELKATLVELIHEPTGATVMHIANDDPENLFCLSLQTYPLNSHGAPHILEHTVLCGSKKYPVKDPFFAMSRRSLNTFMNALTGSDFTCYPAASQVEKDFYNILEVYIDAVFHPSLNELSFLQEGIRLEFSEPKDPKSHLVYKGIVFNEMKGALASADSRLWHSVMEHLLPDLPYAFNSGGDPKDIPKISYEELVEFHESYYHPSRCLFFFYGNLPLKKHLDFIADHALKNVPKIPALPPIPLQKRFTQPKAIKTSYPFHEAEDLSDKTIIVFSWLTTSLVNQEELLALCAIDSILMETDASLLKLPLLKSGLCIQADSFMDTEMSEVPFLIVCKGCKEGDAQKLKEVLVKSLREIVKNGIAPHLIEAAIHQLEMSRIEITGDHAPFGLTLFMRSALAKQHGCDTENSLMIHALFNELLIKAKDPSYLPGLIEKHLLKNPHLVQLTLVPDPKLLSEEESAEKKELQEIQERLSESQANKIIRQTEALAVFQKDSQKQNLECLPKVDLGDIPVLTREILLKQEKVKDLSVFHHDCFTNGMLYADLVFDLPEIAEEDLPLIQLLSSLVSEVGIGDRSYADNLEYMNAHVGGIGAFCALNPLVNNPHQTNPCLHIRGKSLSRKSDYLIGLLKDAATSLRLDETGRIKEMILQLNSAIQNRLPRNAMRYAVSLSLSSLSIPSHVNDIWHGLKYFKFLQKICKNIDKQLPKLIERLTFLKEQLFCLENPHLVLSCDEKTYESLYQEKFYGLADLPGKSFKKWTGDYSLFPVESQGRIISSPVAFTAQAYPSIHYLHPHAPELTCAANLFENKILHQKIREEGGAYGSGAVYNPMQGYFYFQSHHDPHIARTVKIFDEAIHHIAGGNFDERELEEAKLGIIQHFDAPVSPASRALTAYSWWREGKTHQMRQHYRDHLLSLTSKEICRSIEKELVSKKEESILVTFAGKELLEKENTLLAKDRPALPIFPI